MPAAVLAYKSRQNSGLQSIKNGVNAVAFFVKIKTAGGTPVQNQSPPIWEINEKSVQPLQSGFEK